MQQNGEPSVEEILESIKQVIARDNRDSATLSRQRKAVKPVEIETEPEVVEAKEDEILDLGPESALIEDDIDESDELIVDDEFDDEFDDEDDDIDLELDASDEIGDEEEGPLDTSTLEGLTTASATEAMRQSLAALSMLSEPSAPPKIVRSGETSLEGLVRDLLRPMLAQWLEANLPEIVERQVKAEITRIAGKRR
tara:strand:+ start:689 stop:1276 length:588 start_codon:yes stop_codon:yes gene_type:complete